MAHWFKTLFAATGTKTAVPDAADPSGYISYDTGYGPDYQRVLGTDPLAKTIERDKLNQVLYDITGAVQQYQTHGFPDYIDSATNGGTPYVYAYGAIVRFTDGINYFNSVDANTNAPDVSGWKSYGVPSNSNLLINSNGLVNQRKYVSGTATTAANQYTIDMFRVVTSGQNLTFTTTAGVTTFTAPAGGVDLPIENKNILGGSYVLSFTGTATAVVAQSANNITYADVTPTAGVYTITGGYYVRVRFSGGTFSKPKFEEGTISTPYGLPKFGGEILACQRYLPSFAGSSSSGFSYSTTNTLIMVPLKVTARIAPTGLIFPSLVGVLVSNGSASAGTPTSVAIDFVGVNGGSIICTTTAGSPTLTIGEGSRLNVPDASIALFTGCEL